MAPIGTHQETVLHWVANGVAANGHWQTYRILCDNYLPQMIPNKDRLAKLYDSAFEVGDQPDSYLRHVEVGNELSDLLGVTRPGFLKPVLTHMQNKAKTAIARFLPDTADTNAISLGDLKLLSLMSSLHMRLDAADATYAYAYTKTQRLVSIRGAETMIEDLVKLLGEFAVEPWSSSERLEALTQAVSVAQGVNLASHKGIVQDATTSFILAMTGSGSHSPLLVCVAINSPRRLKTIC